MDHKILGYKLEKLCFPCWFLFILKSFLSELSHLEALGDVKSSIVSLKVGEPQSLVLYSVLFNLYVHYLPKAATYFQVYHYPDETVLLSGHPNCTEAITLLERDSISITDRFDANLINATNAKTKLVYVRNSLKSGRLNISLFCIHRTACRAVTYQINMFTSLRIWK